MGTFDGLKEVVEYKIFKSDEKWILSERLKFNKNFGFVAEGNNPSECFDKIPSSAGIDKKAKFLVKIDEGDFR